MTTTGSRTRIGFVLEQALGHVTYGRNIASAVSVRDDVDPVWLEVPFAPDTRLARLPFVRNNWTLRASLEARRLWNQANARSFDSVFLHTQTVSLFAGGLMREVPTVLSLDATPLNFDAVGAAYGHAEGNPFVEALKRRAYKRVFARAALYTTWSQWTKDSLTNDYGVDASRVRVLHPGADLSLYPFGRAPRKAATGRPLRLLFVGGDFTRKGGDLLLTLLGGPLAGRCELDVVSNAAIPLTAGVRQHRNVGPNSPELLALYKSADVFVLPTRADCLAVVLGEAMASALPIITTPVGAHAEAVRDGQTGYLIDADDLSALHDRIERLIAQPGLALEMGRRGRILGEDRFDARKNAQAIGDMLIEAARRETPAANDNDRQQGAVT
jgi:glycosyltransferase involved in cell wall biosynthesis